MIPVVDEQEWMNQSCKIILKLTVKDKIIEKNNNFTDFIGIVPHYDYYMLNNSKKRAVKG